MSKPSINPLIPEDQQSFMACVNCAKFTGRNEEGNMDWGRGGCSHTGASTVPPLHVCEAWTRIIKRRRRETEE